MDWKPIRKKGYPVYKQIAEYIQQRITFGEFPPGTLLPSERTLAKELLVNRSTVVAAYEELQADGWVERKKGSGTRVSSDIWGLSRKRVPNWRQYVERGTFLPNYPMIRHIQKETKDNDLIDMASGELSADLFPTDQFRVILSKQEFTGHLGYENLFGNLQLRKTLATHVKKYKNIDATPSSILITSGAQQALYLIVQCLLSSGDAVAIEDPSYCYSLPIFHSAGIKTFLLPVDKDGVNPDDLSTLHKKQRIRMVFLNPTYQNPTGTTLSIERRKRILELSSEFGIPIIEDDPYTLTSFQDETIPTLKSMDSHGTVLYISSLTKIVASGLRIGWVIGPQAVVERLADAKQQIDFGQSIIAQWAADQFLSSDDFSDHMGRLQKELKQKRDMVISSLHHYLSGEVDFVPPEGGIHLWCKILNPVDETQLVKKAIEQGVVFVPGSTFGSKEGYVRFTFGRVEKSFIEEGISRFAYALRDVGRY